MLRNLEEAISAESFVLRDGLFYQPMETTPEKFLNHLGHTTKTLDNQSLFYRYLRRTAPK